MRCAGLVMAALLVAQAAALAQPRKTLDIYFIDVEGGQSTLIVTPAAESLLVDTGWDTADSRDAKRIIAAVHAAGVAQIDYLMITHLHADHDGGVPALTAAMHPRVAIFNNSETKGGDPKTFSVVHVSPGLEDRWQLHRSGFKGARQADDDHIANLDDTTGHMLKLAASDDGSFTITNTRSGVTKHYGAK